MKDNQIIRYTHRFFPSYKHIPKLTPHPTRDPRGHSYSIKEKFENLNQDNWKTNEHYLYGIDLFNYSYWWEAHEIWEGLWQISNKNDSIGKFLQGIIQLTSAFLKIRDNKIQAAKSLISKTNKNLEFIFQKGEVSGKYFLGIDVIELLKQIKGISYSINDKSEKKSAFTHLEKSIIIILHS